MQKHTYLSRVSNLMGREATNLLPKHKRILADLGENLKLARLRRKLSSERVAERAGVSRSTLFLMENGSAGASTGRLKACGISSSRRPYAAGLQPAVPPGRRSQGVALGWYAQARWAFPTTLDFQTFDAPTGRGPRTAKSALSTCHSYLSRMALV